MSGNTRKTPGPPPGRGFHLIVPEWPLRDRTVWSPFREAAAAKKKILRVSGGVGVGASRSAFFGDDKGTLTQIEFAFGFYLAFLLTWATPLFLRGDIATRFKRENVLAFVAYLQSNTECGHAGIAIRLHHLRMMLMRIAPDFDLGDIWIIQKAHERLTERRDKAEFLKSSSVLFKAGIDHMRKAKAQFESAAAKIDILAAARDYRNGCLVAFLAIIPLRRMNLATLQMGINVFAPAHPHQVLIDAGSAKAGEPIYSEVDPLFWPWLDFYRTTVRPFIPGASSHEGLWASTLGRPLSGDRVYSIIVSVVEAALGCHVWPHLFRAAYGTHVADLMPDNLSAASDGLGHNGYVPTTQQHYVLESIEASKRVNANLLAIPGIRL